MWGTALEEKIVGGSYAAEGEFPFVVSLIILLPVGVYEMPQHGLCGGVLYNERIVITAAHCIEDYLFIDASLGTNGLFTANPIDVIKTIPHENYDASLKSNDIALLLLSRDVEFNDYVQPICLPNVADSENEQTIAMGWGHTQEGGGISVMLQKATVPIIDREKCREMSGYFLDETMICAGYPEGITDACNGDSGGPLVIQRDGHFELVGVVSHGTGCARKNKPGVYADAYYFKEWIITTARELQEQIP